MPWLFAQLFDEGYHDFAQHFLVEPVLALEALALWVVLAEEVVGVADGVVDAEEAIDLLAVLVSDALELLSLHLVVVLYCVAGYAEGFLVVFTSVEEFVLAGLEDFARC